MNDENMLKKKFVCSGYVDSMETHANLEIINSAARLSCGFTATGSEHESDGRTQLKPLVPFSLRKLTTPHFIIISLLVMSFSNGLRSQ